MLYIYNNVNHLGRKKKKERAGELVLENVNMKGEKGEITRKEVLQMTMNKIMQRQENGKSRELIV